MKKYLYNTENGELVRANLVYTPYISDNLLTMSFNRDISYHNDIAENKYWTEEILSDRYLRELKMHSLSKSLVPVLPKISKNDSIREIQFRWSGIDFYEESNHLFSPTISNWQEQWHTSLIKLWNNNIVKISLHPNSFCNIDNNLHWFNWFFSYNLDEEKISIDNVLIQISKERQLQLFKILKDLNINTSVPRSYVELQALALLSFKKNYPESLINESLIKLEEILNYGNRIFTY